ncbi:hypothetical protein AGRO_0661 [Agrobacterium sp. ATCC 31749]|nr:hypothetical protein AGRO_0661 [Agrobacterium sp. ATCC 31749]
MTTSPSSDAAVLWRPARAGAGGFSNGLFFSLALPATPVIKL